MLISASCKLAIYIVVILPSVVFPMYLNLVASKFLAN